MFPDLTVLPAYGNILPTKESAVAKQPKPVSQMTEKQFDALFPVGNEDACKTYLKARRWPNGAFCPRCGNTKVYELKARSFHWQCQACDPNGYRFSVIAGTVFENTNKPLRDWFKVAHLMMTSKKGISARQLWRYMGFGSLKTAWYMAHRIRAALIEPETKLGGIVEVDETYIGGKAINKHRHKRTNHGGPGDMPVVIGAVSRKGNVVARVLNHLDKKAAHAFVREVVSDKVSLLASDESRVYDDLVEFSRGTVNHRAKQYVVGAVHTNTIEGFWSIFKRGIVGSFHKVSEKYLPLYVAEFQFRYNNRKNPDIFAEAIAGC
jgi:transposase-like protein